MDKEKEEEKSYLQTNRDTKKVEENGDKVNLAKC